MQTPAPALLPPEDGALARGTRLGRYELVRRLAVGGMAELYLARQAGLGGFQKLVALKRILPQYAQSSDFVAMFLDEARLAATIQHANVAQVYDLGRTEHGLYFTMEYVHGEDVRACVNAAVKRDGELPLGTAIAIAAGAAAGLHAAHELVDEQGTLVGLVHRDVSPSNVLISYSGCVKLIDFGVAKAAGRQQETRAGTLKGKISYMSPEQCAGGKVDRRSDVFALGVVLYEMTTGTRLFTTDGGDYALMKRIVEEDAPRPSTRRRGFAPELEGIVMRALKRDPAERYASAQALQLDLERFARRHGLNTSMTELGAYVRGLFPARGAEPPGVTRAVRMATGTPHVDLANHPRFGIDDTVAADGATGDGDGEPAIEVVTHTSMFESEVPSVGGLRAPGSGLSSVMEPHHRRRVMVMIAMTAIAAAAIAVLAMLALRPEGAAFDSAAAPSRSGRTGVVPVAAPAPVAVPVVVPVAATVPVSVPATATVPVVATPRAASESKVAAPRTQDMRKPVARKPAPARAARTWDPDSALPPP